MLKAKQFPSQIRVGADVAYIPRFQELLLKRLSPINVKNRDGPPVIDKKAVNRIQYWARRVLSRMEWPRFMFYLGQATSPRIHDEPIDIRPLAKWTASRYVIAPFSSPGMHTSFVNCILTSHNFLHYRWAAKEAAIKAHSHRRLYMPQISIIKEVKVPRPIMLVDPPNALVRMSAEVAWKRGLNTLEHEQKLSGDMIGQDRRFGDIAAPEVPLAASEERNIVSERTYWRYKRVRMEERQVASVSISHDKDYAFAVVQALDEPCPEERDPIIVDDDGEDAPIHEPQIGDDGFLALSPRIKPSVLADEGDESGGGEDFDIQGYMQESSKSIFRKVPR